MARPGGGPRVRVTELRAHRRGARLRMPFRFGAVTVNELDSAVLRIEVEAPGGRRATGVAASVLSPAWFDRRPDVDLAAKERGLLRSLSLAAEAAREHAAATPWDIHRAAEARARAVDAPELVASFGPALVDAAILDAVCRLESATVHEALRDDLLGFGPIPDLPARPVSRLQIRHTVGLADVLEARELAAPLDDGLPQALDEVLAAYGHRWLKVKVDADVPAMVERLAHVARVVAATGREVRYTLDGNESFSDPEAYESFVRALAADPRLRETWARTAWIEQPLARDVALAPSPALARALALAPVVLDESDSRDEVVEEGLARGYAGISVKACKGVYRALHSARVVRDARGRGRAATLCSEDLTCLPVAGLHQDLCVVAALGVEHTERNGHHYVRGLSALTARERADALEDYPRLYRRDGDLVHLRIDDGAVDVRDLTRAGAGLVREPEWSALDELELPPA